jgi:hypothetical protein
LDSTNLSLCTRGHGCDADSVEVRYRDHHPWAEE